MHPKTDRNFDPITDHFTKKVYGGLKGEIRLAVLRRDLSKIVTELSARYERHLHILDVGAGLAQLSIEFATQGHLVTVNDISENMLTSAKQAAKKADVVDKIRWLVCPYQELNALLQSLSASEEKNTHTFDLVLCHALLEWLANPEDSVPYLANWLNQHGRLSLCFYNPASFVYRNLIMGNFNLLNNPDYKADNTKSLTPNNPVSVKEVKTWLHREKLQITEVTGLRVFHDYSPLKRGGHNNPDDVIAMELRYSNQAPYKWLGRYLHVMAQRES